MTNKHFYSVDTERYLTVVGDNVYQMDTNIFDAALERTKKTWRTYILAICVLCLTLLIDAMSGFTFLSGKQEIDLAGFKVVREALSATYGILFSVFIANIFLESRLIKALSHDMGLVENRRPPPALQLWFLSPLAESSLLRRAFWLLFILGFLLLAVFAFVHLALVSPPDPARMSAAVYRAIGAIDCLLLIVCCPFAYRTYQNLRDVRFSLHSAYPLSRIGI